MLVEPVDQVKSTGIGSVVKIVAIDVVWDVVVEGVTVVSVVAVDCIVGCSEAVCELAPIFILVVSCVVDVIGSVVVVDVVDVVVVDVVVVDVVVVVVVVSLVSQFSPI